MDANQLEQISRTLARRPGHEMVRAELHRLLTDGLGHGSDQIVFELQIAGRDVLTADATPRRGRIDALLGRTVFEVKTDLRREVEDARHQLVRYLGERRETTGQEYVGVATDGATFQAYALRGDRLDELGPSFSPKPAEPRALPRWLESVVALREEVAPDVETVRAELGRESVHYARAIEDLEDLWERLADQPEVRTKRDVWARLLATAYGTDVDSRDLFLQHTYLTIVAKAMATLGFFAPQPIADAEALLTGRMFFEDGITGAVESDFFDWVLADQAGHDLAMRLVRHVTRFRLREIEADILKGLYESLIDPETRHDLGEYYTPDWLAARICEAAIHDPWSERVIDPACGSGTFLFHALRRLIEAGREAGATAEAIVGRAASQVLGIDVHPVAVIFARATWLLGVADVLAQGRPGAFPVPVYLGDALQWNRRELMGLGDLEIIVPQGDNPEAEPRVQLMFPEVLADDPGQFDDAVSLMVGLAERGENYAALNGWLDRHGIAGPAADMLRETARQLSALAAAGRNHIWGYVARNLSRPVWLASEGQKADVVIGNPPWVAYSRLAPGMKERFREEMRRMGLWGGLTSVSGYDLSSYFFARAAQLYLRRTGRIAFVMPHAALTRKPYKKFRRGDFGPWRADHLIVRFTAAWSFPSRVQPLFPVPSAVLFAEPADRRMDLPERILVHEGRLPRRDARPAEANVALASHEGPWPAEQEEASPYLRRFRQGAILVPRRFVFVERLPEGRFGPNPQMPRVRGRTSNNDKKPWKDIEPIEGPVEAEFIRTALLGECIAPYRMLVPLEAVIPVEGGEVMDSATALRRGYRRLSEWLQRAEALFDEHGTGARRFVDLLDYIGQLSSQFPVAPLRVIYAASGSNPAAMLLRSDEAVIEHKLYWTAVENEAEGHYLAAILNSETVRSRAEQWQSMGLFGARDFDKVAFNLPIPTFNPDNQIHVEIANAGILAEQVANGVADLDGSHFQRARRTVREGLAGNGISERIDELVARLLDGA